MKIYKYQFDIEQTVVLEVPAGSRILSCQVQAGSPTLWALVDPEAPLRPYHLRIFGTGWQAADAQGLPFLGTIQLQGGALVYHVFDGGEKSKKGGPRRPAAFAAISGGSDGSAT